MATNYHWKVGFDSANGEQKISAIKYKLDGTPGKRKDIRFPSVRSQVSVGSLGIAAAGETTFDYWQWHDIKYTVGDTALEHARGTVMSVSGRSRYGGEAQLMMIAVGLHMIGVKDGDTVDLCVLAPPADANKITGAKYREGLERFGHKLTIAKNGKKEVTFNITNVTVFAETVAASIACQYDDAGQLQRKNPMVNSLMLIDGGRVTLDRLIFRNGKIDKTSIASATNDRLGISNMVLMPAGEWIRANLPSVYHDGAEELADRALRSPQRNSTGDPVYRIHRNGEPPRNITSPIVQSIANYHSAVRQFVDQERTRSNVMRCLLFGGIEPLIGNRLRNDFGANLEFISLKDYPHLKNVEPNQINAVGALRWLVKKALVTQ